MTAPLPLRRGAFVVFTVDGQTSRAMVMLASANGESFALGFDGLVAGYVGFMPVLWTGGRYIDLVAGRTVTISRLEDVSDPV